jgi:hypothetical protein
MKGLSEALGMLAIALFLSGTIHMVLGAFIVAEFMLWLGAEEIAVSMLLIFVVHLMDIRNE